MIIKSMLNDDLYKLTMCQAVINKFPNAHVEYKFINRGGAKFTEIFVQQLKYALLELTSLKVTDEEIVYLRSNYHYFTDPFLEWFSNYTYNINDISINLDNGDLDIAIRGPWYRTILWEVKLMAIISELYFQSQPTLYDIQERALEKADKIRQSGIAVADFGTRRRHSHRVHNFVLNAIGGCLIGTSNMHFAKQYSIPAIGTMAHEWIMAHSVVYGYEDANECALMNWQDVYGRNLAVALTDTYTSDVFFRNKRGLQFDGLRQDSGDPIIFAEKAIKYYEDAGINPLTKKIVFSDNLNIDKAIEIAKCCRYRIGCVFGIGTNLTNDIQGIKPLNMVIKLSKFSLDGTTIDPVVKLSDDPGKHTGNPAEIAKCKSQLLIS